jgi:hypothetical protein
MRERGDLTGFAGAADGAATATESVAACICRGLWRLNAIASCLHVGVEV